MSKLKKQNSRYFQKVRNDVLLQRGYDRTHKKIQIFWLVCFPNHSQFVKTRHVSGQAHITTNGVVSNVYNI